MGFTLNNGIVPDFNVPTKIYVRNNILNDIGDIVSTYGSRALIITNTTDFIHFQDTIDYISRRCIDKKIGCIIFDEIPPDPNTDYIDSAVYFARKTRCDVIIGFGGIHSINSAKAVSLLINNHLFCEDLFSYPVVQKPVNLVTIPVSPLFGFEIIPYLYLADIQEDANRVYNHPYLYPGATVIDSKIFLKTPGDRMTQYGISTLSMATESVISTSNNGIINSFALRAIDLTFKNLPLAFREPDNEQHHLNLAYASIMAGIAFTVSELSLSLAISLALSSITSLRVETAMALMLPHVMEYNLTASPGKYVQMSKVMDENVKDITVIEAAIKAVEGVRKLESDVEIPQRLSQFEISKNTFSKAAEIAMSYPFIENAPRQLTKDEIETILIAAY